MKRIIAFSAILMIAGVSAYSEVLAQNQSGGLPQQNFQGIGNQYFVDEAGLQLLQTASPLDEFIDEDTYYLGPYDVLSIYGKGLVEFSYRGITVNASGDISTPLTGIISISGKTLAEAALIISEAFQQEIKDTDISVSLDRPRPVNVYISSQVSTPGKFTLPAGTRFHQLITGVQLEENRVIPIATNDASLISSSGLTSETSVSRINTRQLSGTTRAELNLGATSNFNRITQVFDLRILKVENPIFGNREIDLAAFFNSGDTRFSPYIMDGDQITLVDFNQDRPTISFSGAVVSPFTGTYRKDDTPDKLLKIVKGLTPEADSTQLFIYRQSSETGIEILTTDLANWRVDGSVLPNDRIVIKEQPNTTIGNIEVRGQVELPGNIPIIPGQTTLAEVLEFTQGLREDANPSAAYLLRESLDNRGVRSLTDINMMSLTRTSDQFLEGFDYMELEQALEPNRMAIDLNSSKSLEMVVQNGDILYVPKDENTVTVLGQVNVPGFYAYDASLQVSDYLAASDGLTIAADENRIYIIKAGSRAWYTPSETDLQSGDIIFVDRIPFEDVSTGRIYDIQHQQLKNQRTQLILGGISAVAGIVTAFVAITR